MLDYILLHQGTHQLTEDKMIYHDIYNYICKDDYNPIYKKIHEKDIYSTKTILSH